MWDEKYSIEGYVFGKSPNDFLAEMTGRLSKGECFVLGGRRGA
jgi:hypothetical protein